MMKKIQVKIGEFIKEHFYNIVNECERDRGEVIELEDIEYSKRYLGLNANFSFLKKVEEINERDNKKYWKDELLINNIKYRVCSQFGGSKISNGKTRSQREGEHFFHYLKNKGILLDKYNVEYIEFLVGLQNNYLPKKEKKELSMNIKNIILYGVAGVGKTHNTNKIIELIEDGKSEKEIFEIIKNNELSESIDIFDIKERVKFITFHQSFGYEDFIEGFRPNEEGNIELVDGIFKKISNEAKANLINSISTESILSSKQKEEELFELFIEEVQTKIDKNGKYFINDTVYIFAIEVDSFRYKGKNWQNSQKMKFVDIKLLNNYHAYSRKSIKDVPNISGLAKQHATYFSLLTKQLLEFSENQNIEFKQIKKEQLKNYYLVIDEINRGNISKIFGELITLIEEDKRDKVEVTLPYSKKPFKIPSNLYIIGTMNTTDKSIALIDIALRRRFTFLKMKPNINLVPNNAKKIFKALNEYISKTLGEDYQIGHSYFMSGNELDFILEYKIQPLLEEYFYGDEQGLKEVFSLINSYH